MRIHLHIHNDDPATGQKLDRILSLLATILQKEGQLMAAIDDLQADVTAEDTVIDSVVVLLKGLSAALATAGVDPTKLAALRADIQSKTQSLAAAVVANTPAAKP
jgi:uncharacterized protein YoxC